jgi:hypothetical protein
MLRPVLWFATAYTLIIILHETAHAVTGLALGVPSTLFNFWVNHDFSRTTASERAAIGVAGPTFSLVVGVVCWSVYRRVKGSRAGLPLAYLAAFGVTNFFGNLMSAAFVGDFSNAAAVLGLSPTMRYAASFTGAVSIAAILFLVGRELGQLAPSDVGRFAAVLGLIALPALAGTALVIVINQPTPMGPSFVTARASEGAFWLVAAVGALSTRQRRSADGRHWYIRLTDGPVALGAILAVRIMAAGILLRR